MENKYYELSAIVARYPKSFGKCNVNASTLYTLEKDCIITETKTEKRNNHIISKETAIVSTMYYANVISGCGFFKDRITKAYTYAWYIPVRLFARNPYSKDDHVIIREYHIKLKK